eukprot:TRINITY_DN8640_c0_g1_i1.p1 TRINITY_DN8640_c0_g1~~TRINITY_DN8640_c0_g1_i1.p1  ORF type:complete len:391 (+),score=58.76 TRINITY_DN8640_c0_g1_i1:547-1719(+)
MPSASPKSIWRWGVRHYQEKGANYFAAVPLSEPCHFQEEQLQQTHAPPMPLEFPPDSLLHIAKTPSLVRDQIYLMPICWVHGEPSQHYIFSEMHDEQRRRITLRDSDVVVQTYPRSGTTWTEQLVLMILNRGDERVINPTEKNTYKPHIEGSIGKVFLDIMFHGKQPDIAQPWGWLLGQDVSLSYEQMEAIPFRRVFKSHLHAHMFIGNGQAPDALERREMPPFTSDAKVVYVIRDPRDIAVSFYTSINACNYSKHGWPIEAFISLFVRGYTPFGSWKDHVVGWLRAAKEYPRNVLVITYEDNYNKPLETTLAVAEFLQVDLNEQQLRNCVEFCSFRKMKSMSRNSRVEHVRKGGQGNWKQVLPEESKALFLDILRDPELGDMGKRYLNA